MASVAVRDIADGRDTAERSREARTGPVMAARHGVSYVDTSLPPGSQRTSLGIRGSDGRDRRSKDDIEVEI